MGEERIEIFFEKTSLWIHEIRLDPILPRGAMGENTER